MNFWNLFFRLLPRKPRSALIALYWHVTRRRVRARNRLLVASKDQQFAYDLWIETVENNSARTAEFGIAIESWPFRPRFTVLVYNPAGSATDDARRSITSIERQIYSDWSLIQVETEALNSSIAEADGEYLVLLRSGDILADVALYRFAEALQSNRAAAILYGDEDLFDRRFRRFRPWFKPRWNAELFLAQDYLVNAVAIDVRLAREIERTSGAGTPTELLLLATSASRHQIIVHVPHILCHVASPAIPNSDRLSAVRRSVHVHGATCSPGPFGTVKVEWPLPSELPLVSVIVPTKDKLELLRPCVETVLSRTTYKNFELLIVDNGSVEYRTREYLREIAKNPKVRVIKYPRPYNFSAINNYAVREANGSYLCLLNNDTEIIEPDWLTEMLRYAVRPEIGAVGAKLLYEDGSIQHAGVVVGIGEAAGHVHRFLPSNQPGYFLMAHLPQFMSAVTAACLVIKKSKFEAVRGLDEKKLAVAFNDVDLCLKLEKAGWRNVYVPHAVLMHHESKSRGSDMAPDQFERYRRELSVLQERWSTKTYNDPLHNPNLDRYSETYTFRF